MASVASPAARARTGPLHAILLAFPVALYPSALLCDITYLRSAEMQWSNFAAWLIAGADVFAGLLIIVALVRFVRGGRAGRDLLYLLAIAAMFVAGVVNAFKHSQDGWSSVGTLGLFLSLCCALLALFAAFLAFSEFRMVRAER